MAALVGRSRCSARPRTRPSRSAAGSCTRPPAAGEELEADASARPRRPLRDDGTRRGDDVDFLVGLRRRHLRARAGGRRGRRARMRRPPHARSAVPRSARSTSRTRRRPTTPARRCRSSARWRTSRGGARGRGGDRGRATAAILAPVGRSPVRSRSSRPTVALLGVYEDDGTKAMPLVVLAPAGSNDRERLSRRIAPTSGRRTASRSPSRPGCSDRQHDRGGERDPLQAPPSGSRPERGRGRAP